MLPELLKTQPVTSGAKGGGPLSAQEQYEKLKHFLPMTSPPETARPQLDELVVGAKLRVEHRGAWWAAKVREVDEARAKVKIGYDTWSNQHDEWIPRDSERFFHRPAGDLDADEVDEARRAEFPESERIPVFNTRQRPFVPKPYNPEKEFQKRQLRLREKIAHMHRAKLGDVDPSLESIKVLQVPSVFTSEQATAPSPPSPSPPKPEQSPSATPAPPAPPAASSPPEATQTPLATPAATLHTAAHADAAANVAPPAPGVASGSPAAAAQSPAAEPVFATGSAPAPVAEPAEAPAFGQIAMGAAQPSSSPPAVPVTAPAAGDVAKARSDAPAPAGAPAAALPPVPSSVRWEEVLSESKERYYHEVATGRTQWELPSEGWVELVNDDGSRYYWEPSSNTTQWTSPP